MKVKTIIVLFILIVSFLNNILINFNTLKKITNNIEKEVLLAKVDPRIKIDKPTSSYIKIIFKYVIYFIFFFDVSTPSTVIDLMNYI